MPIIYDLTAELEEKENLFRITWVERERREPITFTGKLNIPEEIFKHWEKMENHLIVGQALFDLLDGDNRFFVHALNQAFKKGEKLQVHLRTCKETADWPFELLANNNEFLLLEKVLLVRQVSDRGCERKLVPGNRPLRILFMACDPLTLRSGLNYEREEEAILETTRNLPVELEVEDSGSLKGLQQQLIHKYYDIVHLSGHAGIEGDHAFFNMEKDTGDFHKVYPGMLFNEALIENNPRLLFMSGCRSGQMTSPEKSAYVMAFTRRMVEDHNISAVLGWGRSVKDLQANVAEKIIYNELSRGKTLPEAVMRARYEMKKEFPHEEEAAWPLLRLYCDGTPHTPMVKIEQQSKSNHQQMTYTYLANSNIKLLKEGFIGRRRQIQLSLKTLDEDDDKVGVLLLGIGGLGKSCLAGKIC
ncbi:MAG TPA: CHAT domain-containing protein, partial [Candidatus Kapabacteria bacterium]|nr:CHAT domain-containing protein [Candidatus Kapabacteria bacterium]